MEEKTFSDLSVHISEGCLIVPIQGEINDERMNIIQNKILEGVERTGVKGVVIDVSGVRIIEPYYAQVIDNIAKMIYLLGARTVLTGIRPGVAISLVDSNFDFKEIYGTAGTFEEGVGILKPVIGVGKELEEFEEEIEMEEEFIDEEEIIADEEIEREEEIIVEEKIAVDQEEDSGNEVSCDDEGEEEAAK